MALMHSTMLPLGTSLPRFSLRDVVSGTLIETSQFEGNPVLVAVICNHCPFVIHIKAELSRLGRFLMNQGIKVVAVSANDPTSHPQDGIAEMKRDALAHDYSFPYVFDEEQSFVQSLQAVCTPEFYLFDDQAKLYYRGRLDEAAPGNAKPVTGADLRRAAASLLDEAPSPTPQIASRGCSIKWKPGNEPKYLNA